MIRLGQVFLSFLFAEMRGYDYEKQKNYRH